MSQGSIFKSVLLASMAISVLSGCGSGDLPWAPKDQKISASDLQRTDFGSLRVGKFAMSVLNMEILSRNIEVVRGALFNNYATQKGMVLQKSLQGDSLSLEFDQALSYKPQQKYQAQQTWQFIVERNTDQTLKSLSAQCNDCAYQWNATSKDGKQQQFNLKMTKDAFSIQQLADGTYQMSSNSVGQLVGEAFGKNSAFNLESSSSFVLSELTEQPQTTVRNLKSSLSLKKGLFVNLTASELSHNVGNNCGHFVGVINHSSGKQVADLRLSNDGIEVVGDPWRSRYFSCQEQPILELSRLLKEDKSKK